MINPHVDLDTGKIYGCEKNSRLYYHEQGHLVFNDIHSGMLMVQQFIFLFWMLCITAGNKWLSWISFACYGGIYIYEEYWCNRYASKKMKRKDIADGINYIRNSPILNPNTQQTKDL